MKRSRFHTMLWAGERAALRSCAFSVFILWKNHTIKRIERAFKKERGRATLVYMLLVSRQVPVSQQYWRKRIGPSLADRSRVELALLPRLSLTRLSRTQSLFLFGGRSSLSCYYPQGAQQPRCILSYRKKRSVAIRTTGKEKSITGRQ